MSSAALGASSIPVGMTYTFVAGIESPTHQCHLAGENF